MRASTSADDGSPCSISSRGTFASTALADAPFFVFDTAAFFCRDGVRLVDDFLFGLFIESGSPLCVRKEKATPDHSDAAKMQNLGRVAFMTRERA